MTAAVSAAASLDVLPALVQVLHRFREDQLDRCYWAAATVGYFCQITLTNGLLPNT